MTASPPPPYAMVHYNTYIIDADGGPVHNPLSQLPAFISSINRIDDVPAASFAQIGHLPEHSERERRRTSTPRAAHNHHHNTPQSPSRTGALPPPSSSNGPSPPPIPTTDPYSSTYIGPTSSHLQHAQRYPAAAPAPQNWALPSPAAPHIAQDGYPNPNLPNPAPFDPSHDMQSPGHYDTRAFPPSSSPPTGADGLLHERIIGAVQQGFQVHPHPNYAPSPNTPLHISTNTPSHPPSSSSSSGSAATDFVFPTNRTSGSGPPSASTPSPAFTSLSVPTPIFGPRDAYFQGNSGTGGSPSPNPLSHGGGPHRSRPSPTPEAGHHPYPYPPHPRRPRRNTSDPYHVSGPSTPAAYGPNGAMEHYAQRKNSHGNLPSASSSGSSSASGTQKAPRRQQVKPDHPHQHPGSRTSYESTTDSSSPPAVAHYPQHHHSSQSPNEFQPHDLNSLPPSDAPIGTGSESSLAAWNATKDLGQQQLQQQWYTPNPSQAQFDAFSGFSTGPRYSPVVEQEEPSGPHVAYNNPAMTSYANQAYVSQGSAPAFLPQPPFSFASPPQSNYPPPGSHQHQNSLSASSGGISPLPPTYQLYPQPNQQHQQDGTDTPPHIH